MDVLLEKGSGAETAEFRVVQDGRKGHRVAPVTLFLVGTLESGKQIGIEYNSEGTTWVQCKTGGSDTVLDANSNMVVLYGSGNYRVSRAADAGTVGVKIA